MAYLGKLRSLPDSETGIVDVAVPSLSGDATRQARPLTPFKGLIKPYKLDDVVIIEDIEGYLFYRDTVFSLGEYPLPIMEDESYGFVCPFGYIKFTETSIVIEHKSGVKFELGDKIVINSDVKAKGNVTSNAPGISPPVPTDSFTNWG